MSRRLKLREPALQAAILDITGILKQLSLDTDSKVKIDLGKYLGDEKRKAKIIFTEEAWFKMQWLIAKFDSEVAWHGVARRDDDPESDNYYITDILLYPQKVTGSTVNTDQFPYSKWLMELDDDTFNNLRMHGHSHVNMQTNPSSVDLNHRTELLEKLSDDMFYIFLIMNKSNSYSAAIYDYKKNIYFDTNDVDLEVECDGFNNVIDFMDGADKMVRKNVSTAGSYRTGGSSYGGYSGYSGYGGYSGYSGSQTSYGTTGANAKSPATTTAKKSDEKITQLPDKASSKKKDKEKKKGRRKSMSHKQQSLFTARDLYDYDDYVD